MNVTAAISILVVVGSLGLGLFVLSRGPSDRVNQLFLAISVVLAIWGIGDIVSLSAHSTGGVLLGRHIAFAGWCLLGPIFFHFTLEFAGNKGLLGKWWFYLLLYGPFIVSLLLDWSTHLVYKSVVLTGSGYKVNIWILWWLVYCGLALLILGGVAVLVRYRVRTEDRAERERVTYIIVAALIPLFGSFITEWMIPFKGIRPPINSLTLLLVMEILIAYAVSKRGLMSTLLAAVGGTIVSIMNDPVLLLDSHGVIDTVNPAALKLTGYEKAELEGASLDLLFTGGGRTRDVIKRLATGKDLSMTSECTLKDGSSVPVTVAAAYIRSRSKRVVGSVVILHDMRGALELIRAEERAELQQKHSEELKNIIDVAAHELRHPASLMLGYAVLLRDSWSRLDADTVNESLASISNAAVRISHLSADLLDASLVGSGELELVLTELKPFDAISVASVEIMERNPHLEPIATRGDREALMKADAPKIRTVLAILLDNAVKFSEGQGVEAWFEQEGDQTTFFVADRGCGIPEEHRERVFERFHQVDEASHHSLPGMGLGLFIARVIVDAHRGSIHVESRDGGGSVFVFTIPAEPRVLDDRIADSA
jgi:PAS domain S-box-containing protein